VTPVLVDTSVVMKWFHEEGEAEVAEARALLAAHQADRITAYLLDLSLYELGNVLIRSLRWSPTDAADQLDDLIAICGDPLVPDLCWHRDAASLAALHGLSYYDASFAAAAAAIGAPLVSADKELTTAGLAESPSALVRRLRL
jgi:predicted nucleic acid-binding protein